MEKMATASTVEPPQHRQQQQAFPSTPSSLSIPPIQLSWFDRMQKNKPQGNSIAAGLLVFCAGSIHVAWTCWSLVFNAVSQTHPSLFPLLAVLHLAAMIGNAAGAMAVTRLQKRTIYYVCVALMGLGNAMVIAQPNATWALLVGRLIVGLAYGLVYVPLIAHAGENSVPEMRARIVSSCGLMSTIAMLTYAAVNTRNLHLDNVTAAAAMPANMLMAIVSLAWVLMGAVLAPCLTRESVVFLLQQRKETEAAQMMCRLRSETTVSWSVHNELNEMRAQVEHEQRHGTANVLRQKNVRPLLLVAGMSVVGVLSNNALLCVAQAFVMRFLWPGELEVGVLVVLVVLVVRMLAAMVPVFVADAIRRRHLIASAGIGGAMLVLLGVVLVATARSRLAGQAALIVLVALAQLAFGLGADVMPHVMAAEAFALRKKPWSVALVAMLEHLVHVLMCLVLLAPMAFDVALLYVPAAVLVALVALLYWLVPETRGMSLTQCREEFVGGSAGWEGGETYSREARQRGAGDITFGTR